MAPPKKGDKKPKKKKPTIPMDPFEFVPPTILDLGVKPSEFVKCRICNISLNHLNFEWPAVPTDITLSVIKDAIRKRHGGTATDPTLYMNSVNPSSLIKAGDGTSLKQLGVQGTIAGNASEMPTVTLHYDFQADRDDLILGVPVTYTPSQYGLNLKSYLRMKDQLHLQR